MGDDRGGEGIARVVDGAARRCHGSGSGRCRRLLRFRTKLIEYRLAPAFGWFFIIDIAVDPRRKPGRAQLLQPAVEPLSSFAIIFIGRIAQREHGKPRSEEHTSELQSLMRISYAVF